MNKRIHELAVQIDFPMDYENPAWAYEQSIYKFAELIVRECCDWIEGSPSTDAGQLLLTKSFIIANLKEHFGVEE